MATIQDVQQAVSKVAETVGPRVVGVSGRRSAGSGVVVAPGKVLTNAHNLSGEEVQVIFAGGRTAAGRAVAVDPEGDVAILEVDTQDAAPVEWAGGSANLSIGAPVFALA